MFKWSFLCSFYFSIICEFQYSLGEDHEIWTNCTVLYFYAAYMLTSIGIFNIMKTYIYGKKKVNHLKSLNTVKQTVQALPLFMKQR